MLTRPLQDSIYYGREVVDIQFLLLKKAVLDTNLG